MHCLSRSGFGTRSRLTRADYFGATLDHADQDYSVEVDHEGLF